MEGAQAGKAGRTGRRSAVVTWTLAGGIAGIVFGIIRVFDQTPGCIYRGTFSADSHTANSTPVSGEFEA